MSLNSLVHPPISKFNYLVFLTFFHHVITVACVSCVVTETRSAAADAGRRFRLASSSSAWSPAEPARVVVVSRSGVADKDDNVVGLAAAVVVDERPDSCDMVVRVE